MKDSDLRGSGLMRRIDDVLLASGCNFFEGGDGITFVLDAAKHQIREAESDLRDAEYEADELQDEVESLEDVIAELRERIKELEAKP